MRESLPGAPTGTRRALVAPAPSGDGRWPWGDQVLPRLGPSSATRSGTSRATSALAASPSVELADQVGAIPDAERVEQFGQGRIGQGHRCDLLGVHLVVHIDHHADGSPHGGPDPLPETPRDSYGHTAETIEPTGVFEVSPTPQSLEAWEHFKTKLLQAQATRRRQTPAADDDDGDVHPMLTCAVTARSAARSMASSEVGVRCGRLER